MKKTKNIFSIFLFLCLFFLLYRTSEAKYSKNGYETWTMKDAKLVSKDYPDMKVEVKDKNGKKHSYTTTRAQGMNVGKTYIYFAKICMENKKNKAVKFHRTDISTGKTVRMDCKNGCQQAGHVNDLLVVSTNLKGKQDVLLSTTSNEKNGIARFKINGTKLSFIGYIKVTLKGKSVTCGGLTLYKHDTKNKKIYFLIKRGEGMYHGQISEDDLLNKKDATIPMYKIADLDRKNAILAGSKNTYSYYNMETWVSQGFNYNPYEKTIYTIHFKPKEKGEEHIQTSIIQRYYVGDIVNDSTFNSKSHKKGVVFATKKSFLLKASDYFNKKNCYDKKKNYCGLEIEASGFRTHQGTNGDTKMYINADARNIFGTYDAVFSLSYKTYSNTGKTDSIAYKRNTYTVKYDGNGGKDTGTNTTKGNYKMSSTRHIYGVKSGLRPNYFKKNGYKFGGWHLSRERKDNSDGKTKEQWLYLYNGKNKWFFKDKKPKNASLSVYKNKQVVSKLNSNVNNDVITCHAYWK